MKGKEAWLVELAGERWLGIDSLRLIEMAGRVVASPRPATAHTQEPAVTITRAQQSLCGSHWGQFLLDSIAAVHGVGEGMKECRRQERRKEEVKGGLRPRMRLLLARSLGLSVSKLTVSSSLLITQAFGPFFQCHQQSDSLCILLLCMQNLSGHETCQTTSASDPCWTPTAHTSLDRYCFSSLSLFRPRTRSGHHLGDDGAI